MRQHREKLDLVAKELLKKETLEGAEFEELVNKGEKLHQVKEQVEKEPEEPEIKFDVDPDPNKVKN